MSEEKENEPLRNGDDNSGSDQSLEGHATYKAPTISDFVILKPISRGAFGKVFLGQKKDKSDQIYAIKVMKKADMVNKNMVNQVIAERDALAVSKSPYIVRLFYSLQSEQNIYLVMEYMIGGDVKSLLTMYGYFDEDMAVRYIAEVILALEYLHNHNIIHRDLKPDNMLISPKGHIKLTDFGLSKINLNRQIGICDIVNTPCAAKSQKLVNYFRTPGQVLSLTSALAFSAKGKRKVQLGNPQYTGSWGNAEAASPRAKDRVRASTPQFKRYITPPPAKELTPTLLACRSTASEQSLLDANQPQHTSMSHEANDDVFISGEGKTQFVEKTDVEKGHDIGTLKDASQRAEQNARLQREEKKRNADSTSSNDDDTPHLHRSRQSLQESYAAQHLRSMRKSSGDPTPANAFSCEKRFERDFLQNVSVSSIEVQRKPDMSMADSPMYSNIQISTDESSPDNGSPGKKRPFTLVDRSPLRSFVSTGSHTGMTMSFEAFAIGDEHLRKRSFVNQDHHASPSLRTSRFKGLRSFKSRFSSLKSKKSKRLSPCTSSHYSSLSSTKDSLMYLASVSSLGSETDLTGIGAVLGVLPSAAGQALAVRARTQSSSSSDMDLSSPLRRCPRVHQASQLPVEGQRVPAGSGPVPSLQQCDTDNDQSMQHSPIPGCAVQPQSCNTSMEVNLDNSSCSAGIADPLSDDQQRPASRLGSLPDDVSLVTSSPRSEITHKSSLNSLDVDLMDAATTDSDTPAVPLPATPDSDGRDAGASVTDGHNPFKTPSPVRQMTISTPVNYRSASSVATSISQVMTGASSGDSFCLERLFSSDSSISSDPGNLELDTSLNELSLKDKNQNSFATPDPSHTEIPAIEVDRATYCTPVSHVSSTTTTVTLTPDGSYKSKSTVQTPIAGATDKPKNKMLRKVTTFMSLPASSDENTAGSLCTPVTKGYLKRRHFMTPGLARLGQTPLRTPRNIAGRPCTYNDDNSNRILGTPDYLAPELLLQKEHTYAVDWWALGVCFYEFLTGIPPFNDVSPELIFQHILNRDLEWPEGDEGLSAIAKSTIETLLTSDPTSRPKANDLRQMPMFADMDWDHLHTSDMPFIPDPDDALDTCYFDARNEMQHLQVSAIDM